MEKRRKVCENDNKWTLACGGTLLATQWIWTIPVGFIFSMINILNILFVVVGPPCAKKARKEDPLDIFVFDLTSSSEEESCDGQNKNLASSKAAHKHLVKTYGTRSKKFQQISTKSFAESGKITTQQRKSKKSVVVTVDTSDLQNKTTSTSKFKQASCTDEKTCSYSKTAGSTNTPNRPIRPSVENGIPRSKVAQNFFQVKC